MTSASPMRLPASAIDSGVIATAGRTISPEATRRVFRVEKLRSLTRLDAPCHEHLVSCVARDACAAGLIGRCIFQAFAIRALDSRRGTTRQRPGMYRGTG